MDLINRSNSSTTLQPVRHETKVLAKDPTSSSDGRVKISDTRVRPSSLHRRKKKKKKGIVNLVTAHRALLRRLMKSAAGVVPHIVQINAGTVINIWAPSETLHKPAVVLVHGFAADGIMTWLFQVGPLSKKHAVYVSDLLFFGGSATDRPDRSPEF
ncbi:sn-glycerol-3-phosphate import ATP-binding protein UgpC [Striga asiatica]|uniref:sn-glycerol-3-phosphate import ATP-binding protein UgpC n=1 Tax=Striga asiatica TaxID=4170 RepID=A0A5A7QXG2_STRAF|nr:sn-glycerol-3-phosphate import ATP-binding protein UgpC [Striga asiatica]